MSSPKRARTDDFFSHVVPTTYFQWAFEIEVERIAKTKAAAVEMEGKRSAEMKAAVEETLGFDNIIESHQKKNGYKLPIRTDNMVYLVMPLLDRRLFMKLAALGWDGGVEGSTPYYWDRISENVVSVESLTSCDDPPDAEALSMAVSNALSHFSFKYEELFDESSACIAAIAVVAGDELAALPRITAEQKAAKAPGCLGAVGDPIYWDEVDSVSARALAALIVERMVSSGALLRIEAATDAALLQRRAIIKAGCKILKLKRRHDEIMAEARSSSDKIIEEARKSVEKIIGGDPIMKFDFEELRSYCCAVGNGCSCG